MKEMEVERTSRSDLKIADGYGQNLCSTSAQIIKDVSYGIHPTQALDIYLPPGRSVSSTKILVIIHGGGFNSGSKDELSTYVQPMQRRLADYAFFNITYRQATTKTPCSLHRKMMLRQRWNTLSIILQGLLFQKRWFYWE